MNKRDIAKAGTVNAALMRIADELRELHEQIATLHEAEMNKLDNMPDGLRESERSERMQAQADAVETMALNIEAAFDALEDATGAFVDLEEA